MPAVYKRAHGDRLLGDDGFNHGGGREAEPGCRDALGEVGDKRRQLASKLSRYVGNIELSFCALRYLRRLDKRLGL